mmetsp:Transcript_28099/g.51347  ORF Transcript_28099/g.51347 Transcript_28099/m.51347 type:complete len:115 (+) Transcript_28099:3-347(+)
MLEMLRLAEVFDFAQVLLESFPQGGVRLYIAINNRELQEQAPHIFGASIMTHSLFAIYGVSLFTYSACKRKTIFQSEMKDQYQWLLNLSGINLLQEQVHDPACSPGGSRAGALS